MGVYWQTTGKIRRTLSEEGWSQLPVLKGKFYNHPQLGQAEPQSKSQGRRTVVPDQKTGAPLPMEALTAAVLDVIFPRTPTSTAGTPSAAAIGAATFAGAPAAGGGEESPAQAAQQAAGLAQPPDTELSVSMAASPTSTSSPNPASALQSPANTAAVGSRSPLAHQRSDARSPAAGGTKRPGTSLSPGRTLPDAEKGTGGGVMQAIRRALLVRYPTLKEAFDAFARDFAADKGLTKPDWRNMLSRHGFTQFSGRKEINEIFKSVASAVDGYVTLKEFHTAIELIAPVRTFEGLRRKWLAQGFTSMAQAFRKMDADDAETAAKRLDLAEFASLMRKAGVEDDGEHAALFESLCDSNGTASIEEVHSAVAMVSPSLLLEDLRERLLKRYKGSFEKAFFDLDLDHGGSVSQKEFVARGMQVLDLTRNEAEKAFREIDIDNSGDISMAELNSAMALVDPSLLYEDLRLKVRQRFRSIQEVLNKAFADEVTTGLEQEVRLSRSKFQRALRPLGLTDKETADLFDIIDNDGDGLLTPLEFVKGVRRFAPAGVFEDLRTRCCQTYGHVRTAFASVKTNRSSALAYPAFFKRLASLQLLEEDEDETKDYVNLQAVFDLLDVHHEGVASIGRLVAALSSCGAGARVKLPREESDQRAREEIQSDVSSAFRIVNDLRRQVRCGLSWDDVEQAGVVEPPSPGTSTRPNSRGGGHPSTPATATSAATGPAPETPGSPLRQRTQDHLQLGRSFLGRSASAPAGAGRSDSVTSGTATTAAAAATQLGKAASVEAPEPQEAPRSLPRATAPRLKTVQQEDLPEDVKAFTLALDCRTPSESAVLSTQECWSNIWGRLREPPQQLRPKAAVEKELHSYFQGAAMKMSQDVPLLSKFQSRFATHQTVRLAQGALKPAKVKKPK